MIAPVSIPRATFDLAGALHQTTAADPQPAIVIATPGSSVKEQIAAVYGTRLAAAGYPTLTFDPAYQGRSGGEPRDLEDPYERGADIRAAIDFLATRPEVDAERIGVLGICAGGGYAVHTAMTDHRIKAVGTVVPVNIGRARRQQYAGDPRALPAALDALARRRTAEVQVEQLERLPWIPDTMDEAVAAGMDDVDLLDAIRFYRTPRGFSEFSTNRRLVRSDPLLIGFDAFHLVDELLTQPVKVVVGGRVGATGSYDDGHRLAALAPAAEPVDVIDGAGHYELYDDERYVDRAVALLTPFFRRHLGRASEAVSAAG